MIYGQMRWLTCRNRSRKEIKERSHQIAVRLEIESNVPKTYANILTKELDIDNKFTHEINGPLNICDLLYLYNLSGKCQI